MEYDRDTCAYEEDCRAQATRNAICRQMEQRFRLHPDESTRPALLQKWILLAQEAKDEQVKHWFHLTLSASPNLNHDELVDFYNLVRKLVTQKHAIQGIWTPEYHNEEQTGGHPHAHIVIQSTYSCRNLQSVASRVTKLKSNFCHVVPKNTVTAVRNALIYVQKNRGADSVWRLANGLTPLNMFGEMDADLLKTWIDDKPPVVAE